MLKTVQATGPELHSVATTTHGRVLVRRARSSPVRGVLAGFHGYSETAAIQLARLEQIPGANAWTLVSVQALHRFYRGRAQEVGASWMTREDREAAMADNLAYAGDAIGLVLDAAPMPLVCAGFSQGVSMAYRAAIRGRHPAAGVLAVGGDVPPELLADPAAAFPPVFVARGNADEWYTAEKFGADLTALRERGVHLHAVSYDGPHEWTPAVSRAAAAWLDEACGSAR